MNAMLAAQRERRMVQEHRADCKAPRWFVTFCGEVSAATAAKIRDRQTWRMVR